LLLLFSGTLLGLLRRPLLLLSRALLVLLRKALLLDIALLLGALRLLLIAALLRFARCTLLFTALLRRTLHCLRRLVALGGLRLRLTLGADILRLTTLALPFRALLFGRVALLSLALGVGLRGWIDQSLRRGALAGAAEVRTARLHLRLLARFGGTLVARGSGIGGGELLAYRRVAIRRSAAVRRVMAPCAGGGYESHHRAGTARNDGGTVVDPGSFAAQRGAIVVRPYVGHLRMMMVPVEGAEEKAG